MGLVRWAYYSYFTIAIFGWSKRGKGEYKINTIPCGHTLTAIDGETILEAALRQGLNLPYVCRDGACGVCKGKILKGTVDYGTYQEGVLTEAEKMQGKALFCCAKPLSDLDIECHEVDEHRRFPIKTMSFSVQKMERAAQDVMLLELVPEGEDSMNFYCRPVCRRAAGRWHQTQLLHRQSPA